LHKCFFHFVLCVCAKESKETRRKTNETSKGKKEGKKEHKNAQRFVLCPDVAADVLCVLAA
jgi:hypothetical protein